MTSVFDKLNLRPGERRLVVIAAGVVFVFLNLLLVFPHFGDLGRVQQQTRDARATLNMFQKEIDREPAYKRRIQQLAEQGAVVAEASRALELSREVTSQALVCGVQVKSYDTVRGGSNVRTNAFFDEQSLGISIISGEKELLCFLYSLAERSSLIRVRSMNLQPEPPHRYRLQANITLVGSYQKQFPSRPAQTASPSTPAPAPTATAKTAATPPRPATPPPAKDAGAAKPAPPGFQKVSTSPPPPAAPAKTNEAQAAPRIPVSPKPFGIPTRTQAVPQRQPPPATPGSK
jgi:hypothetical protein